MSEAPRSILVLRLSALGDVIHTLPAVQSLRAGFPDAKIGWVVERAYGELVRLVAPIDQVFEVATRRWRKNLTANETRADIAGIRRELRSFVEHGWSIDFQGLMKSAVIGGVAGAPTRIGFDRDLVRERASLFFTNRRVPIDPSGHVVDLNLRLARAVGGAETSASPAWQNFAADATQRLAIVTGEPFIVLLPGTGQPQKSWPTERYAALATELSYRTRFQIFVVPGPGEELLANEIATQARVTVIERTSLAELTMLLSMAKLVIGGDTGPIHLADSVGTPVVGLYGPTDPARNGPYHQLDSVVSVYDSGQAIDLIEVEPVLNRALSRLAERE